MGVQKSKFLKSSFVSSDNMKIEEANEQEFQLMGNSYAMESFRDSILSPAGTVR